MPTEVIPPDDVLIAQTERWFLRRGIPHFIDDYRATDDVFTRALPVLLFVFLVELLSAADLTWAWWLNVLAVLAASAGVVALWAGINRLRGRRWSQLPDSVGAIEIGVFLAVPTLLPIVFGGQVRSGVANFAVNVVLLAFVYLVTSYGVVPMTRWALGQTVRQLGAVVGLFGRALPLLLLFTVALFINTEVWQVAAALDGFLYAATILFFVLVGTAFLLIRLPGELGRLRAHLTGPALVAACASSPLAEVAERHIAGAGPEAGAADAGSPPLTRRQQGNVLLVLFFSQAVQVILVTLAIAAFFFAFGTVAVRPEVVAGWLGGSPPEPLASWTVFGRDIEVTRALINVSGLLGALSGFYFTVYVITDATYREEFFTEIVAEVRESLAVRAVYLGLIAAR